MAAPYKRALFMFRRDLRLIDNTALNRALVESREVLPLFALNPAQLDDHPYRSGPALSFMAQSLMQLQHDLVKSGGALLMVEGEPRSVLRELILEYAIDAVFVNRDFTPFSHQRDRALARVCDECGCDFIQCEDLLLQPPESAVKADGSPYRVFTPFYRNASKILPAPPQPLQHGNWLAFDAKRSVGVDHLCVYKAPRALWQGGRSEARTLLKGLADCELYQQERDFPAHRATSRLSAHLKFGTCSVREVFHRIRDLFGDEHPLLRQLYWRDFFTHIAWHFPHVFGQAFDRRYQYVHWSDDRAAFERWCEGNTGFPIIDAGMRELNQTGYMHNRVRMIVASFLVKDLHIDWRWGERYFARHLIDYDPCVNNGSWQWAASTGCDAQPWFRIFNPWLQQQKFDPQAEYIQQWVPELNSLSPAQIHRLDRSAPPAGYPTPLVDHKQEAEASKQIYREALERAEMSA